MRAELSDTLFPGELALDGTLRHTRGILPMVALARERGLRRVYVPAAAAVEAIQYQRWARRAGGTLAT